MKRLTTNCPDNNLDAALNLFYIKDSETWVRGGGLERTVRRDCRCVWQNRFPHPQGSGESVGGDEG